MTTSPFARTVAIATTLLLLAAGCAGEAAEPEFTAGDGVSYGDDDVVLRVDYTGGFVDPATTITRLPALSIYGDGRVITEGPQIAIYPGPALPNVQVQQISRQDVRVLVERALDAGVGAGLDFGHPPIADAASTRFTVLTQVGPQSSTVYALGPPTDDGDLSDEQRANRAAMWDLFEALTDLPKTLGADAVSEPQPYRPTAIAAVATRWEANELLESPPELAWPGPALPGDPIDADGSLRCVTVTGDEASALLNAAAEANQETPWVSGDTRWRVTLRPLLPDEAGCGDLP